MLPDDQRHGTYAGAVKHYFERSETCRPCKDAAADYRRNQRARRYLARGPLIVPAIGTQRRVQALCALGYHMREIDEALGHKWGYVSQLKRYDTVYRSTALAVADLYNRWSAVVPEPTPLRIRQRKIAAARGWAAPLCWDNIDNPREQPKGMLGQQKRRDPDDLDRAVVERLLTGQREPDATRAERVAAMTRWLAWGRSEKSLCELHGWHDGRYVVREQVAS